MKKVFKRSLSVLLAFVMLCSVFPFTGMTAVPPSAYTTGDIITFGSYPQTKVTDSEIITALNALTLGADDTVNYDGSRYKQVFFEYYTGLAGELTTDPDMAIQDDNGYYINTVYWFKFEPVQWRVLSNTNGELFVMAEKILASRAYNQQQTDVTWETCDMRSWLNNDFCNTAFHAAQQAQIKTSTVVNEDNPLYGTDGGNDTTDKLFLLSYSEVLNPAFGFSSDDSSYDTARLARGTDFAKSNGLYVYTDSPDLESSSWRLRSPGDGQGFSSYADGYIFSSYGDVCITSIGARPAFKLHLTTDIITSKNGSGCVVDKQGGFLYGLAPGISGLDDFVDVEAGYELAYVQTTGGFGTGTVIQARFSGEIFETYQIVIFGDVNGDGSIDSLDAGNMVDYENYMVTWDPLIDAAKIKAADLNGDGTIDSIDAGIAVDAENYMVTIDQSTGLVAGG